MAGGEAYKEMDTSSIVSSAVTQDTVKVGSFRFRKRELILGAIAFVALLLVLIMAIVLAVEVGKGDDDDSSSPSVQTGAQTGGDDRSQADMCITPACLKTAHYQKSLMDETFDPCQDFYSYACGRYDMENPQTYLLSDVTPFSQIRMDNFVKMIDLLNFPVERNHEHSYERKLKHFLSSCNDHFDRMDQGGLPLIDTILKKWEQPITFWGEEFDPSAFDLDKQLQKSHIDWWTPAFFTLDVVTNLENWNKQTVETDFGGLGMAYELYLNPQVSQQALALYTEYMTHVLKLLSFDNGMDTANMTAINTFVNDVIVTEHNMASIIYTSPRLRNPHQEDNMMTLDELTDLTNNTFDFVSYMKMLFNEYPSLFDGNTKVAVRRAGYFHQLGRYMATLEATDDGKRQLNSYMLWTLINRYSHDLSWNYVHAKRKLQLFLYGIKDDTSGALYCFTQAENSMSDAMDAVFVKNFVKSEDKAKAEKIVQSIRREMLTEISNLPWMSAQDRLTATKKISRSLYKIGYADYMVNEYLMDTRYSMVDIDEADFFSNKLNLNKAARASYNTRIGSKTARTEWSYHIFNPSVEYWNPWHELIATAAVFQNPVFSNNGPAYHNFGSVGSIMAKHLIHAVDEYGSSVRLDGSQNGNWWANVTTTRYQKIRSCAMDAQKDTSLGTYLDPYSQNNISPNISLYADFYVPELLADSSGLRLAFKSYKSWEGMTGSEKIPPGFPKLTTDQMFFISYAQANCQNTPDILKMMQLNANRYPSKSRVNLAVSQVPEFAEAFKCRQGSPLRPAKTCNLF